MLSLKYLLRQCGPSYQFELSSDYECSFELHNLSIAAFNKSSFPNGFTHISYESLSSNKFIMGNIKAKRTQDGFLRASIMFGNLDFDPLNRNTILSATDMNIILLSGILSPYAMLHVHAHFEVAINQPLPLEQLNNMILCDEFSNAQYDIKHFNTKSFMVYEENPIVVLPKKRKPRPRVRANIKTKLSTLTGQESIGKKNSVSSSKREETASEVDENNQSFARDYHRLSMNGDLSVGENTYKGISPFVTPHQAMMHYLPPPSGNSMNHHPSTTQQHSLPIVLPSRHMPPPPSQQPQYQYTVSSASIPVMAPNSSSGHGSSSSSNGRGGRTSTFVATTTTTMTTTTTSVIPVNNPDLFFGYIFEDNEVILPTK